MKINAIDNNPIDNNNPYFYKNVLLSLGCLFLSEFYFAYF